ncbi:tRNA pseudouridine synthase-like 1 [Plutella xylostella]|uniref:tRNA pseudouridine synthase-like 1 n=1 Tax=Plutella xylostella TaxID=51655 RepID=UPI002032E8F7|nr:tRNA pseudouridine synthase-like 1 [Plutella xylostella]
MKARYLSFFSYIGTGFRSSEKIWLKEKRNYPDPESVQGVFELALLKLRSHNYPNLLLSSRTDGGVHALNATAHFDLETSESNIYNPADITFRVNKYFFKNEICVSVKNTIRVNDDFNARFNAKSRTYLYRLAILKNNFPRPAENLSIASYIPLEEWKRCHFLRIENFDIDRFREGAQEFLGIHDFTTFKKFDKETQTKHNRRSIHSIEITPGRPQVSSFTEQQGSYFDYYDIKIHGRAFVHNQIRRMLGALVGAAAGKISTQDIRLMLQIPSKNSWLSHLHSQPAYGLYLCDVEYDPQELIYDPERKISTRFVVEDESD